MERAALSELSELDDWKLVREEQDIRGWRVLDAAGRPIGTVEALMTNTETEEVDALRLETGMEIPTDRVTLGENAVYLRAAATVSSLATPMVASPTVVTPNREAARTIERPEHETRETSHAVISESFQDIHDECRRHYAATYQPEGKSFDAYLPAYQLGHTYGKMSEGRSYDRLEPEIRSRFEREHGPGSYQASSSALRHAFGQAATGRTRR